MSFLKYKLGGEPPKITVSIAVEDGRLVIKKKEGEEINLTLERDMTAAQVIVAFVSMGLSEIAAAIVENIIEKALNYFVNQAADKLSYKKSLEDIYKFNIGETEATIGFDNTAQLQTYEDSYYKLSGHINLL